MTRMLTDHRLSQSADELSDWTISQLSRSSNQPLSTVTLGVKPQAVSPNSNLDNGCLIPMFVALLVDSVQFADCSALHFGSNRMQGR
jgi:hypothetical protein